MQDDESFEAAEAGDPGGALRPAAPAWSVEPDVQRAPHIGSEFDAMIELVSRYIASSPHLQRVAHYTSGIHDFGVDVLRDPALARPESEGRIESRRARYLRGGQNLTFMVGREDDRLQDLRTGRIIRTVLHSDRGAIFCTPVRRGEHLTGLCLDGRRESVDTADLRLARLVTAVRGQLGLGSQNPGGWLTARPVSREISLEPGQDEKADDDAFVFHAEDGAAAGIFRAAVGPDQLNFVATYKKGELISAGDCLDAPSIRHLFTQMTPGARRQAYREVGKNFHVIATQFSQLMRAALNGHLVRVVFDVEQGAIYYYRLPGDIYMVGVTLVQSQVSVADHLMAELARNYVEIAA